MIGPIQSKGLANLGVTQIACAEKRFLILSRNGRVYTQAYNSDTLVGVPGAPLTSGRASLSCRCDRGLDSKLFTSEELEPLFVVSYQLRLKS